MNYQEDILVVFQWFAYFRTATTSMSDDDNCLEINPHDFAALMLMMDRMRIAYKKKRRVEKADGPACIEDLQDEGKWPTNGFKDLNRAIMRDVNRWEIVFRNPEELRITKPIYTSFMRLLCASFYGTSIQERINGIRNLTIKDAKKIILNKRLLIRNLMLMLRLVFMKMLLVLLKIIPMMMMMMMMMTTTSTTSTTLHMTVLLDTYILKLKK